MSHTLLYGGSFDPIHHGHLITCRRAKELLAADDVLLIPAGVSPHKTALQPAATGQERLAMIRLAIDSIPAFAADDRELLRQGPSYTIDTLEELQRQRPGDRFTLLLGADQLPKLHSWHRINDLLKLARIAILQRSEPRPGDITANLQNFAANLGQPAANQLAQSVLETPRIDISSTDIRNRIRQNLPIDFLVPPSVAAYIREHRLYQS